MPKNASSALPQLLNQLTLNVVLIVLGLACAEFALRLFGFRPWFSNPAQRVREHFMEQDSTLGWVLRPRQDGLVWSGPEKHSETILANRTRLVIPTPTDPEAPTILILGDSAIFGWGIADGDTFASQLAQRVPHMRVVNGAVPGYGALQSSLWMDRLASVEAPSAVILGYTDYFLQRDTGSITWAAEMATISIDNNINLPYGRLVGSELKILPPAPYFYELPWRHTFASVKLLEEAISVFRSHQSRESQVEVTKIVLRRWGEAVRALRAQPIVFFWNKDGSDSYFSEYLRENAIEVADCAHPEQGSGMTIIPHDGHPSAIAHRYWAECLVSNGHIDVVQPDNS